MPGASNGLYDGFGNLYRESDGVADPPKKNVRYISAPRVEISERIDNDRHPWCVVPRRKIVARRILYWKRKYRGIDVF